jgi:hypothetical protein
MAVLIDLAREGLVNVLIGHQEIALIKDPPRAVQAAAAGRHDGTARRPGPGIEALDRIISGIPDVEGIPLSAGRGAECGVWSAFAGDGQPGQNGGNQEDPEIPRAVGQRSHGTVE